MKLSFCNDVGLKIRFSKFTLKFVLLLLRLLMAVGNGMSMFYYLVLPTFAFGCLFMQYFLFTYKLTDNIPSVITYSFCICNNQSIKRQSGPTRKECKGYLSTRSGLFWDPRKTEDLFCKCCTFLFSYSHFVCKCCWGEELIPTGPRLSIKYRYSFDEWASWNWFLLSTSTNNLILEIEFTRHSRFI